MEPWLGVLHLVGRDAQAQTEFEAIAAIYCKDRQGYEAAARGYAQSQGYQLLWAEDMHPAGQWIAMYPQHRGAANIARAVHGGHLIELGPLRAVGAEGEDPKEAQYLTITEHEIEPLPDQSGIPFWDREWIAPDLKELLFAQPQEGPAMNTYFIVDATLRKNITGFFDLDGLDVPIKCLFKGDAAQELKTAAPYLIDMTLPEGAWDDKSLAPDFHKDFFKKHWGQNTGIFIRSTAPIEDVWSHFRKFTRVQVEEDKRWVFFRFEDPRIALGYFDTIKDIPEKSAQWVNMRSDFRIETIIGNQTDTENPWQIEPTWEKLNGVKAIGQPVLSDVEIKGFANYRFKEFDNELLHYLSVKNSKFADLPNERKLNILSIIINSAQSYQITTEQAIVDYAEASLLFEKPLDQELTTKRILQSKHHQLDRARWTLKYITAKIKMG